ncbi:MAG: hypothetical protein ABIR22_04905 [Candidatus Eisenbacteria bacterium]
MIPLVGHDAAGSADPVGEVLVVVRDIANRSVPGAVVVIDFSACGDLRLCADPHDPNALVNCANRTVTKVAGLVGEARFRIVGCSIRVPGEPGDGGNCARIYADGDLLAYPSVAIYDLEGCNGLGPPDLSAWLSDYFVGLSPTSGDYDLSYDLGPNDLSLWLTAFFGAGSLANCSNGGRCGP